MVGIFFLTSGGWANADPPARIARLGDLSGAVSFSPAGEDDWVQAVLNRPLTTGDRLWAEPGARTEIQFGGATVRMSGGTSVSILNLDDRIAQLQLTQGTLIVRVRRIDPTQVFEVNTPNVAFSLRQPGEYRIEVDPSGVATTIVVRKGQGEVYADDVVFVIDRQQAYRFKGTRLREFRQAATPQSDAFDLWSNKRDRSYGNSVSARYVSQNVIGHQDLDANGTWRASATEGNVWFPKHVPTGWTPYRDGHWTWIQPWGWTWVDDAPWGFAVTHYGRWISVRGTWGWVPGPARSRAYYAPALVVFVGGESFRVTTFPGAVAGVAWFPLGPREVYQPAYPVSRHYFQNVNQSNTSIANAVINATYSKANGTRVVHANRNVPGAVIAVPATAFVKSQRVSSAAVPVPPDALASARVAVGPSLAPTDRSIRGRTDPAHGPPPRVLHRTSVARTAHPATRVGFATQMPKPAAEPRGRLADEGRKESRPASTVPIVRVFAQSIGTQPAGQTLHSTHANTPAEVRERSDGRSAP